MCKTTVQNVRLSVYPGYVRDQYANSSEMKEIIPRWSPCWIRLGSICRAIDRRIIALSDEGPQPESEYTISTIYVIIGRFELTSYDDGSRRFLDLVSQDAVNLGFSWPSTLGHEMHVV